MSERPAKPASTAPAPLDPNAARLAELERALDEARRISAAKDAFVAAVSHELRSPLHAILGHTELLRERTTDPESTELLRSVNRAARGMLGLTNDLLDMAALGTDAFTLHPADLMLRDLFDEILASFRPTSRSRRVPLLLTYDDALPTAVLADGQRLGQVLTNLIANALRFTDEGRVEVRASCGQRSGDRVMLRVEVVDTGIGVPVEEQASLFVAFAQSLQHGHRRGGTGLGLALCKKLVERMGGAMGHAPGADRGSVFWFTVPLLASAAPVASVSMRYEPFPSAPRRSILVVEDSETNRLWAQRALASRNFEVTLAESGRQALEVLKNRRFDAILMDWHMPEMDGLETTRAIRALGGTLGRVPILGLSASALPGTVEQCVEAGMNDCLLKPASIRALSAALDRVIAAAPRRSSAPAAPLVSPLAVTIDGLPPDVCLELAELFARHVPERCDLLDQALLANDAAAVARHAHSIASAAGGILRTELCSMAQAVEVRVGQGASCAEVAAETQFLSEEARRLAPLILDATRALASAPTRC